MVIMSPLSELTDTDGLEMAPTSQRAPAPPAPALLLPGSVKRRRVGLPPADGKAKFNSLSAAAPGTPSRTPSGAPAPPPSPPHHSFTISPCWCSSIL